MMFQVRGLQGMADRLPDRGEKLKARQEALQRALATKMEQASAAPPQAVSDTLPRETAAKPALTGRVVLMSTEESVACAAPPAPVRAHSSAWGVQSFVPRVRLDSAALVASVVSVTFLCLPTRWSWRGRGLVTALLPHQRHALAWLVWREAPEQAVRGGIFGDDMGLGNTLSRSRLLPRRRARPGPRW